MILTAKCPKCGKEFSRETTEEEYEYINANALCCGNEFKLIKEFDLVGADRSFDNWEID